MISDHNKLHILVFFLFIFSFLNQVIFFEEGDVNPFPDVKEFSTIAEDETNPLCRIIKTGYVSRTYRITNPNGISGFRNIELANFKQEILDTGPDWMDVKITAGSQFSTNAVYPVPINSLPDAIIRFLEPETYIQSDHPEIVALANSLVEGSVTQAEAVIKILSWVRGNITYDYTFSLPNDALSVLRNKSGVCAGFSWLTTALLRAAGIPASYDVGCVTNIGWVTDESGGLHAWISVYYPDVGWIASDPQTTQNMLDASHIIKSFDQCGREGTIITPINYEDTSKWIFSNATPYPSEFGSVFSAHIPELDGSSVQMNPISINTTKFVLFITPSQPIKSITLPIQIFGCNYYQYWRYETITDWIEPKLGYGQESTNVIFNIDGTGLPYGNYVGEIIVVDEYNDYFGPKIIPVELHVVEKVHEIYLPNVSR